MEEDPNPVLPKPEESSFEKPAFLPPKPLAIPHPPKISPSSIPNPSPSVSTNKPVEPGLPNYGYLYSIPGYSAFQPVSFPSIVQPHPGPVQTEPPKTDYVPFHPNIVKESIAEEKQLIKEEVKPTVTKQQDFEDHFTPEIIAATPNTETHCKTATESKMSITSLSQGSGAIVTIPNQVNKDIKKKSERFSLKTSIPISKIDMKCVNSPIDTFQSSSKKPVFNPAFQKDSIERPKVEIQSNIVIKTASKQAEIKEKQTLPTQNNSISTLINAAEAISKNDQFRVTDLKTDVLIQSPEIKNPPSPLPAPAAVQRPMFNPINLEKPNFPLKPPEGGYNEQKNQIVYIQNKPVTNPKIVVTLQNPQNPQVLLQRTNFDSKNLQAPSRLSSQKKSKEDTVSDNGTSSKVVALKRLHQDNGDENDFENLITENQIYGNKIVVKEKSQGTLQEQDLKVKNKQTQSETKNVVLQPSYVYVSNVQFPTNLMMIKTNSKTCQTTDCYKTKVSPNENKSVEVTTITNNCDTIANIKNSKPQIITNKDIHILKSSNVLQTLSNNNNNKKSELVIATNQKVLVSPQLTYQVLTDPDNRNQLTKEIPKVMTPKKELPKLIEMKGTEKKMFIACQYKVDSKLHPKLVIANIKPKIATKVEVVSTLDIYARRKRLRRLKYLSNNNKEIPKVESRKMQEKAIITGTRNIITPQKIKAEIFKEFANTKDKLKVDHNESDSDYGEEELLEYNSIIEEYGSSNQIDKVEFLAGLRLGTHEVYREKDLDKQERNLKHDSVAVAYIAAGVLERPTEEPEILAEDWAQPQPVDAENEDTMRLKQKFLSQLRLKNVTPQFKEAYERTWQEVIKERRRRNGLTDSEAQSKPTFDPNTQLQLLTEIKNCVNINNNLIKKRLDSSEHTNDIRILAEKNFSELNRLSKMADSSVKLLSGQSTRKRDLNPGFDSENIQKLNFRIEPNKDYPKLVIPSISKIVALKTAQECVVATTSTQATSMDEPSNSAAGVSSVSQEMAPVKTRDFGCQAGDGATWPGVDAFMKSYREYEIARKKEIVSLHRRNTSLCVESAHVTRAASRHSDRARALLAERRHLAAEENNLRSSLQRLCNAIDVIRNS